MIPQTYRVAEWGDFAAGRVHRVSAAGPLAAARRFAPRVPAFGEFDEAERELLAFASLVVRTVPVAVTDEAGVTVAVVIEVTTDGDGRNTVRVWHAGERGAA